MKFRRRSSVAVWAKEALTDPFNMFKKMCADQKKKDHRKLMHMLNTIREKEDKKH